MEKLNKVSFSDIDNLNLNSFGKLEQFSSDQSITDYVLSDMNEIKTLKKVKTKSYFRSSFNMKDLDLVHLNLKQFAISFPLSYVTHFSRLETLKMKIISNYVDKNSKIKYYDTLKELYISRRRKPASENNSIPHFLALNVHKFKNLKIFSGLISPSYEHQDIELNNAFPSENPPLTELEAIKLPRGDYSINFFFTKNSKTNYFPKLKYFYNSKKYDKLQNQINDLSFPCTLRGLVYNSVSKFLDLSFLSALPNLSFLNLDLVCYQSQYNFISCLKNLKFLKLSVSKFHQTASTRDWSFLNKLSKLEYLDLSNLKDVDNETIKEISKIPFLSYLDVSLCRSITDLSPLSNLPKLEKLFTHNNPNITQIMEKSDSLSLWIFSGNFGSIIENINDLRLPSLSNFTLFDDNTIKKNNFDFILSFPSMRYLEFNSNSILFL